MSNLIKPFIKLDKAMCYDCMTPIRIYDFEAVDIALSPDGTPLDYNQLLTKIYGVCPKCGKTYEVERNGIGYSITSPLKKYLLEGDKYDEEQKSECTTVYNEFGYVRGRGR